MPDVLGQVFGASSFMPHGHCYLWKPGLVWLHVVSDALIGVAYVAISVTLAVLVRRIRDIPFNWMFLAFGVFIIACGATHFLEVWTVWTPTYWLAGDVKALTALASVVTALLLPPLVPQAVGIAAGAALSEERRRQLESAHQELQRLYGRVTEVDQLKTRFFANVSHELRTPLTLVLGPLEKLLAGGGLDESQREDLTVAGRNARTLLRHVDELLDVAKLEAGRMTVHYARGDLAQLLRLVASHFDTLAAERKLNFAVDAPARLTAEVDSRQIERVVLNLLSNAFKFAPAGGTVRCLLRTEDGQARLVVEDDGPGVPPALHAAIFERFQQGDGDPTRRAGGTGLGLAIVKEFVELHRGSVGLDDRPGGGARFTVVLPLVAPPGSAVDVVAEPRPETPSEIRQALDTLPTRGEVDIPPADDHRPLVLVAEDNPDMSSFIAGVLAPSYRVLPTRDGQEALEKAHALRPDLILSDLMMPRLNGDALVRAVRQQPELNDVPIVMLTAKADDELRVQLLREGAQDYVMKPFVAEELRARLANQVTIKRTRETLQRELASRSSDIEALATEVSSRKRELQTALEATQVARDHAERASQAKSDFLRLISHELRTPLTAMRIYLYALGEDGDRLAPEHRPLVAKITRSSSRLLTLIESLLEYARVETGRMCLRSEPVDLATLAAEVVDDHRPHAEEKGLDLRATVTPGLPPVTTDARLVRLILANLIGNAIKFTPAGSVALRVTWQDGTYLFEVADSGPGIPSDQHQAIFEPFHQLEPLRHKHTPGTGLGLALVRQMVDAIGAHITLRSEVGTGSTFSVALPANGAAVARASA